LKNPVSTFFLAIASGIVGIFSHENGIGIDGMTFRGTGIAGTTFHGTEIAGMTFLVRNESGIVATTSPGILISRNAIFFGPWSAIGIAGLFCY
jgi:hypothetical protein